MDELSKLLQVLEDFANSISTSASAVPGDNNDDSQYDTKNIEYDGDYKTQFEPFCKEGESDTEEETKDIREQDEEVPVEVEKPKKVTKKTEVDVTEPEEPPVEEVPETTEELTGTEMLPGIEAPEDEVPKDPETLGKVYELKKIYARLASVESFLNDVSEPILLKLRNFVSEAIELFQLMLNNVDIFKDKLDDIIVLYYKFLSIVYELLRRFHEREAEEDKKQDKKRGVI